MKIAVIGAGAMGGMLAAKLGLAGNDVTVVDVSEQLVSSIKQEGLSIEEKNGHKQTVSVNATCHPRETGEVDIVFFFVKAHHTALAAESAKPLVGSSTTVVSLQNGWGNADVLAKFYPVEQIVIGITYHSATVVGVGKVAHTGTGDTYLGPLLNNGDLTRAYEVGKVLQEAKSDNRVTSKVKTEVWKKLILNAATLPTSALTSLCSGDLGRSDPMLELIDSVTEEAVKVAQALGHEIELSERVEYIRKLLLGAGKGKSSMLQDMEAHRKTEIEVINAAVVRAGEQVGIDVPLNRAMVSLIKGLEGA